MSIDLKNSLRAAAWTTLFAFVGLFGISLAGWLGAVVEWANGAGSTPFPALSVLGYAAVSAAASASIGIVNFVVREAQARGILPGTGPSYVDTTAVERIQ